MEEPKGGGAPQGAYLTWGERKCRTVVQDHSWSPPGSLVSVSVQLASSRDVRGVEIKDLAQTAMAPAQWLALLTAPSP